MFALKKVATVLCVVVFTLWVPGLAVSALADDDVGPPDEAGMGLSEVEEVGDDAASGWHLNGEVFTTAPVEVGGAVQLETPGRFRLTTSLGVLPNTYIDAAHDLAVGAEVYDAQTAAFISNSLKSSLIWRAHAGWRPFPSLGLYVEGGYALMNIGGGVATTDVVEAVIGQSISGDYGAFNVDATFHMVDAEIGWQVHFWDCLLYTSPSPRDRTRSRMPSSA